MALDKYVESLPKLKQYKLAIMFTKLALPIWNKYAEVNYLTYRDSVVGMVHNVDKHLLENAINAIDQFIHLNLFKRFSYKRYKLLNISNQFTDPVVALQDLDWELPNDVELVFYSTYNLMKAAIGQDSSAFGESTIYISINQSIDALTETKMFSIEQIQKILDDFN